MKASGTRVLLASDLNLLLQIFIIILLVGLKFGKTKTAENLKKRGRLMIVAVILNAVGKSLEIVFPLTSTHALFGSIAEVLDFMFIFKKFGNVHLWMRFTMAVWLITLVLEISIYFTHYVKSGDFQNSFKSLNDNFKFR